MPTQTVTDHRVQVNFPKELYQLVRREAFKRNVSISSLIRDTVKTHFGIKDRQDAGQEKIWRRFLADYAGVIVGEKDDPTKHDEWAHKTATLHE